MNTHDVSEAPQFVQLLLKQKQTLRDAESRKGQCPKERKSRDEITLQFRFRRMMRPSKHNFNIRTSFMAPAYSPCLSSIDDLTKVMINDLLLETHHRGSYLLLRTVTPPDRMTASMAIVEDEDNDGIMLQLYYQEEENEYAAEEILGEGAVLIVKDPYFKMMADGDYGIRVDHLSDIIHLPQYDRRIPNIWRPRLEEQSISASDWKMKGNSSFNRFKYYAAIENYTKALDFSPTDGEAQILRLNRSLAFIKTQQFDAALSDLESASAASKPAEKALFRKAQALYNLRRYRESCEVLKDLRLEYPNNLEAKGMLARAIDRLVEQENGRYKFKQLYADANNLRPPHLDHSSYIGPISVRESGSRGRGLFTTKAVKAGDLLLCEKAFAYAFFDDTGAAAAQNQDLVLLINAANDSMTMGTQAELIRVIVQKLYRNPSLAQAVTDLYHGTCKSVNVSEVDGIPVVDTFLVERIVSLNCFGCPVSSRQFHLRSVKAAIEKSLIEEEFHSSGIWPMASYINHACASNARRAFIGDMMIVRASRDLEPDTEITFWYQVPSDNGYDERQKKFRNWGFKCECSMCQDDRTTKDSVLAERKRLKTDLLKHFRSRSIADLAKMEGILAVLTNHYRQSALEVPRIHVWEPQLALAGLYEQKMQPVKAIDSALKALTSLGYIIEGGNLPRTRGTPMVIKQWGLMEDRLIWCWMLLSDAYRLVAPDLEMRAEHYARISYKICVGEDETFDETYGKLSNKRAI